MIAFAVIFLTSIIVITMLCLFATIEYTSAFGVDKYTVYGILGVIIGMLIVTLLTT